MSFAAMASHTIDSVVAEWLSRVCDAESPSSEIVAFNVGLFESPDGYSAYLCGTKEYNDEDDDWACKEAFTPKERYLTISSKLTQGKDWEEVQQAVILAIEKFLHSSRGLKSFLNQATAITVGFDDGDLTRVR